jgi:PAS domain S-box-containing protein
MDSSPQQPVDASLIRLSRRIALGVAVVGVAVLFGWAFGIDWLKGVLPGTATMKASSAICFVFAGIALWLSAPRDDGARPAPRWRRQVAPLLATLIGMIALLSLIEHLAGTDLGFDQILFHDPDPRSAGRMAEMTALNMLLSAIALLLLDVRSRGGHRPSDWLMLFVAASAFVAVLGYVYGVPALYRLGMFEPMPLHTALVFCGLATGILFARPYTLLARAVTADDAAGVILRRLLPAAVLLPPLLEWLRWRGEVIGLYSQAAGLALHAIGYIAVFAALVWSASRAVQRLYDLQQALARTNVWQQAILNSADFTVVSTDKRGVIRTINSGAARKLGYLPEDLVNKRNIELLHDPEELAARAEAWSRDLGYRVEPGFDTLFAKARALGNDENDWTYVCQDGSRYIVRLSVSPLIDSYSKVSGFVAIGMDITEQRNAEYALIESLRALDDRNRELQDFAFVASHDLQEPLRKIRMFSDRLLESYSSVLDERALEYLRRNVQAAGRMQALIDDLTAYSRIATRGEHFAPVDLNRVVAMVVDDLVARIESSRGKVEWSGLPTIAGDATQLRQVFQNLISNALKFRHADRDPHVRVSAERPGRDFHGPPSWLIRVEDNGIGFDMRHAERVFAPFQRLHARTEFEGSGIGLAIVRRIVERHGGRISAVAEQGRGAKFTMTLPENHALTSASQEAMTGTRRDG